MAVGPRQGHKIAANLIPCKADPDAAAITHDPTMRMRFQADADLNHIIMKAMLRREPSIAFQTAHAAQLAGVRDQEVLALAAQEGRVLVTHDRKTMPKHFAEFIGHATSHGVIVIPQKLPVHVAVADLLLIWTASEAEEWINRT